MRTCAWMRMRMGGWMAVHVCPSAEGQMGEWMDERMYIRLYIRTYMPVDP